MKPVKKALTNLTNTSKLNKKVKLEHNQDINLLVSNKLQSILLNI